MRALRAGATRPWIVAHRGDSASFPQNTNAAFDAALTTPIDGIELDVQLSRDGAAVVHHDRTLRGVGGGGHRVSSLDLAALRALDAGARAGRRFRGERIPTLDEVLDRFGGRTHLLVEVKAYDEGQGSSARAGTLAAIVARAVRLRGLESSVLVLSFDPDVLDAAVEAHPRLRTVRNLSQLPRSGEREWRRLAPLHALSVDVRVLTPPFVDEAHRRGKPVLCYTCNAPRRALAALRSGADGLMSDRPAWLASFVAAHAR